MVEQHPENLVMPGPGRVPEELVHQFWPEPLGGGKCSAQCGRIVCFNCSLNFYGHSGPFAFVTWLNRWDWQNDQLKARRELHRLRVCKHNGRGRGRSHHERLPEFKSNSIKEKTVGERKPSAEERKPSEDRGR